MVVKDGKVTCSCSGTSFSCNLSSFINAGAKIVGLEGGSIAPSLTTFGTPLSLTEIAQELSAQDGSVFDPLTQKVPSILGGDIAPVSAVDGLQFSARDALTAHHNGVITAITAPDGEGFYSVRRLRRVR